MKLRNIASIIFTFSSLIVHATPTVCVASSSSDASYFVSDKQYNITCNDQKNYKSAREIRLLYIPTKKAEHSLKEFMDSRGLHLVATLQSNKKQKNYGPTENLVNQYKILVYSNDTEAKDWIFAKRNFGKTAGLNNETRYDFAYTALSQNNSTLKRLGFTSNEFNQYFSKMGYKQVLSGVNDKIIFKETFYIFNK